MSQKLSCIIPFFNEGPRLLDLLSTISKIPSIDQVICIDDGSSCSSLSEAIKKTFPTVKLHVSTINSGKCAAVEQGLSSCSGEIILLLDADISGIKENEIINAIDFFKSKPLDMIILRRIKASFLIKIIRADVLLSGERLMKKSDLELVFKEHISGYQLEMAINKYMKMNQKKVIWMPNTAKNHYKYLKQSFFKGIWQDLKMYINILSYIGLTNFFIHLFSFCKLSHKTPFQDNGIRIID